MSTCTEDASQIADLIKAGRRDEAEQLFSWYCDLYTLKFWECLVLQDKVRSLSGAYWPETGRL